MAAQRPNVIVFQEFKTLNVVPDTPDLDALIVGPCYQILDYVDDKEACSAGDYGELYSAVPLVAPSAVVISSPPSALPGAELVAADTKVFFDDCQAVLVESGTGANLALFESGSNLFHPNTVAGGVDLNADGIVAGDTLITQNSGGADLVKTFKSIVFTLYDTLDNFEFNTNGVQVGDTITITNDTPVGTVGVRDGTYTITGVRSDGTGATGRTLEFMGIDWAQRETSTYTGTPGNYTCDITIFTSSGAVRLTQADAELSTYVEGYTTTDFASTSEAADSNEWRAERQVADVELDSSDITIDGNEITVSAGITINIEGNVNDLSVSYASMYVEYTALRQDLQKITELSNYTEMEALLGKYDSRNPLFVGAVVAKANTTTKLNLRIFSPPFLNHYYAFCVCSNRSRRKKQNCKQSPLLRCVDRMPVRDLTDHNPMQFAVRIGSQPEQRPMPPPSLSLSSIDGALHPRAYSS